MLIEGLGQVLGMDFQRQQLDIRRRIGFVPEDECLFPRVVGVEFVSYAGELVGMSAKDALQRAHEVLNYVGLGEARYRKVDSYSTGMKQRVKLAAAIVHDPELVILDEPTNGMDPAGREEMLELARDLSRNKGMSLLFSSHLLPDVESVCDEVRRAGRGQAAHAREHSAAEATAQPVFRGAAQGRRAPLCRAAEAEGCTVEVRDDSLIVRMPEGRSERFLWEVAAWEQLQIRHLRPQRSTLEEVFLKAVEHA